MVTKNQVLSALKLKGISVGKASEKLNMTPGGVYFKLNENPIKEDFIKLLDKNLELNLTSGNNSSKEENTSMRLSEPEVIYGKRRNETNLLQTPRLEAKPLHLAADPHDYDNDGSKFEDLGNGFIRFRIPIIPFKAYAGYLRGYQDPEYYEDFKTTYIEVEKQYKGHYLSFEVSGDSMLPNGPEDYEQMALPGWLAVAREVPRHQWAFRLYTHKVDTWIIIHQTEGILIKQIVKHDVNGGTITIHSLNPKYPDEVLQLDDVAQIFSVYRYNIIK